MEGYSKDVIKASFISHLNKYISSGVRKSINRNNHMNEYSNEEFDESKSHVVLMNFIDYITPALPEGRPRVLDLIETASSNIVPFKKDTKLEIKEKIADAILVDFVNFVAMQYCVDYGMYTKDLIGKK